MVTWKGKYNTLKNCEVTSSLWQSSSFKVFCKSSQKYPRLWHWHTHTHTNTLPQTSWWISCCTFIHTQTHTHTHTHTHRQTDRQTHTHTHTLWSRPMSLCLTHNGGFDGLGASTVCCCPCQTAAQTLAPFWTVPRLNTRLMRSPSSPGAVNMGPERDHSAASWPPSFYSSGRPSYRQASGLLWLKHFSPPLLACDHCLYLYLAMQLSFYHNTCSHLSKGDGAPWLFKLRHSIAPLLLLLLTLHVVVVENMFQAWATCMQLLDPMIILLTLITRDDEGFSSNP